MERERRQHTIEMIIHCDEPIAHAQETIGNSQVVMRSKVRLPSGRFTRAPIVTGDTMRHGLREAGTKELLRICELRGGLSESALRLLFNGGMVRGAQKDVVSIDEARELEDLVPHLGLLGGCVGNRIVPGKIESGYAWLIADETRHLLPTWVGEWLDEQGSVTASAREHIEEVQRVRMDALLNPHHRQMLAPNAAAEVEQRLLASDTASQRDDAVEKKAAKSTMMPFSFETVVAGSLLYWRLVAITDTAIERDALSVMIAAFFAYAKVGGKKGTGHGLIRPLHVRGHERIVADRPSGGELALHGEQTHAAIERYRAHVADRRSRIDGWLSKVVA